MAEILRGAPVAVALCEDLTAHVAALKVNGIVPTLAVLRVGERPDDVSYEASAMRRCAKVGIAVKKFLLPTSCSKSLLLDTIREINDDSSIHGCLMFRPLPDKDAEMEACALLAPKKDVDCMTSESLASVFTGKGAGYPPCTAQACIEILDYYGIQIQGKRATVIGRSLVIGKPVSMLLQAKNATVTMCHSRTVDLPDECRKAEILIVAAGKAGIVSSSYLVPGQVVIDVGINVDEAGKLCGDVKFDEAESVVSAITPVPGGVGAVTTAVLCKHIIDAAKQQHKP